MNLEPNPVSNVPGLAYGVSVLFIICVGIYFLLRFFYGRGGFPGRSGLQGRFIRVLDRFPLAPQRYLLIVEVVGKIYLLGITEQSITFLTPLDSEALLKEPEWMEQSNSNFTPFHSYLSALSRRWKKKP